MRVDSDGSVPGGMSNTAASMFGFFSIRIAIDSVFGTLLVTPTGTTAPFSAMSGVEKNTMSLLCAGALPPSAFSVSSIDCVSNAPLFQSSAAASPGFNHPAAATSVTSVQAPAGFQRLPALRVHRSSPAAFENRAIVNGEPIRKQARAGIETNRERREWGRAEIGAQREYVRTCAAFAARTLRLQRELDRSVNGRARQEAHRGGRSPSR